MNPLWRIEVLGGFRAVGRRNVVTRFDTRKTTSLLAFLACHPHRAHPRETLAEQLWPDEDAEATRPRLRQALSVIRRALHDPDAPDSSPLLSDHSEVRLNPSIVVTDVAEFDALVKQARAPGATADRGDFLGRAAALYQGDLLPGFYDEWILAERGRLQEAHVCLLLELAASLAAAGEAEAALESARRAAQADPLREAAHCLLMRLYTAAGRKPDALRQYRVLETTLREEFGEAPSPAAQLLFRRLDELSPAEPLALPVSRELAVAPQPVMPGERPGVLEPVGGAVPLASPLYVVRKTDGELQAAIAGQDSIVLIKGPRQVGKTSLLARGLHTARLAGSRVVHTDLQKLSSDQLASTELLFRTLAELIADQLELDLRIKELWSPDRGWNVNFDRFLKRVALPASELPLVWGLDEVDRLFAQPHASEVFGLFRSWHNERSLDPTAPWARLTVVIAYATEAHLFITDLNQSPFNVGTRLTLDDFTEDQVVELNRRYGSPLAAGSELDGYRELVGGHPYLVRRGLYEMARNSYSAAELERQSVREDGPFGDHLRRLRLSLSQSADLVEMVREVLNDIPQTDSDRFFRLRSAGLLAGDAPVEAQLRCGLYRAYFNRHLCG